MPKHPNYEFIVAFAEGKEVEYKLKGLDGGWDVWETVSNLDFFSDAGCYQYRIKPEKNKTIGYRRYIWDSASFGRVVDCCYENFGQSAEDVSKMGCFVKWIDTEWQYAEYEVEE